MLKHRKVFTSDLDLWIACIDPSCQVRMTPIRDKLHEFLSSKRIFSKVYFKPIHHTPFYQSKIHQNILLPVTDSISSRILTLPLYPNMTLEEKEYLTSSISEFFESLNK